MPLENSDLRESLRLQPTVLSSVNALYAHVKSDGKSTSMTIFTTFSKTLLDT